MVEQLIESNREAVLKHYGKSEEDIRNDVNHIFEWMKKQPHIPPLPSDEQKLATVAKKIEVGLVRRKFSLEKFKHTLEIYYSIKNIAPEIYGNWDILSPEVQLAFKTSCWVPLRRLTPNNEAVGIFRLIDCDPKNYSLISEVIVSFMMGELRSEVEYNMGEHMIFDLKGFTVQHMLKMPPPLVKKMYVALKHAYGLRMVGYHILNAPDKMDILLSLVKPVMSPKLFNRIQIHKDLESLYKVIPREILPMDYGGNEPTFDEILEQWKVLLEDNREKLIEISKLKADDSKRIGGDLDIEVFGSMHGSFRQLQID